MHVCMYGWMDGCMDGCMDVWMYGCMGGWMDGCIYASCKKTPRLQECDLNQKRLRAIEKTCVMGRAMMFLIPVIYCSIRSGYGNQIG